MSCIEDSPAAERWQILPIDVGVLLSADGLLALYEVKMRQLSNLQSAISN